MREFTKNKQRDKFYYIDRYQYAKYNWTSVGEYYYLVPEKILVSPIFDKVNSQGSESVTKARWDSIIQESMTHNHQGRHAYTHRRTHTHTHTYTPLHMHIVQLEVLAQHILMRPWIRYPFIGAGCFSQRESKAYQTRFTRLLGLGFNALNLLLGHPFQCCSLLPQHS